MGESKKDVLRVNFDRKLKLTVQSDFDKIINIERTELCFVRV
jgi:hypothetical protein